MGTKLYRMWKQNMIFTFQLTDPCQRSSWSLCQHGRQTTSWTLSEITYKHLKSVFGAISILYDELILCHRKNSLKQEDSSRISISITTQLLGYL